MARPLKPITDKEIEQMKVLAKAHCRNEEIAGFLGVSVATLKTRFQPLLREARQAGIATIRAKQFELAMKGNVALLIWLGKQICGQYEKVLHREDDTDTDTTEYKTRWANGEPTTKDED